jgi:hypothetical protein
MGFGQKEGELREGMIDDNEWEKQVKKLLEKTRKLIKSKYVNKGSFWYGFHYPKTLNLYYGGLILKIASLHFP